MLTNSLPSDFQGGMFGPYIPTPTVYTSSQTGAISSRLYGTNGAPAAPSAASLAAVRALTYHCVLA